MRECPPELLERLADLEHERWSGWIKHQFKKGRFDHKDETWTMPPWAVANWMRLSVTPYAELDEEAKEMDRVEVRKTWAVVAKALERDEKRTAALEKVFKRGKSIRKLMPDSDHVSPQSIYGLFYAALLEADALTPAPEAKKENPDKP